MRRELSDPTSEPCPPIWSSTNAHIKDVSTFELGGFPPDPTASSDRSPSKESSKRSLASDREVAKANPDAECPEGRDVEVVIVTRRATPYGLGYRPSVRSYDERGG
jgi:hypothetical protein